MATKYKKTGCARLLIILVILAPLTYIGASYINGENGIENIKKLLRVDQWGKEKTEAAQNPEDSREVFQLKEKIKRLEEANQELKDQVDYLQEKLDRLNQQE